MTNGRVVLLCAGGADGHVHEGTGFVAAPCLCENEIVGDKNDMQFSKVSLMSRRVVACIYCRRDPVDDNVRQIRQTRRERDMKWVGDGWKVPHVVQ